MPVKTKHRRVHHIAHRKEKRNKHFLKVYAPYIPLLLIVSCGMFVYSNNEFKQSTGAVKSYATNVTDGGLLESTNAKRASEGLKPLELNPHLDKAAQAKAEDMSSRNYWSHDSPDGQKPWDFIDNSNYRYLKAAENLAYGFDTSKSTVNGWMNSADHRANILDGELGEVGFGIVNVPDYQGQGPETLVVALYGQPTTDSFDQSVIAAVTNPSAESENISFIQSITGGKAPWSGFAIGLLIGSIVMYLVLKHAHGIRKALRRGEKFAVSHPLFDITLVALLALTFVASQTIGKIH